MSRTWQLRICLLYLWWPFWNLFSLAFTLTPGLMIPAEAELSSSSGLRHFAWSWRHTFDQWDFARTQHRSALVAMKFKIQRYSLLYVLSGALHNSKFKYLALCDAEEGITLFLSLSRICATWGSPKTSTWTSHIPSQDLFSKLFNLCEKVIKVLVKRQPDSACYMGKKRHIH